MKVCLLVDSQSVDSWIAAAIDEMLEESDAEISLIIENDDDSWIGQYIETAWQDGIWSAHHAARLISRRVRGRRGFRKQIDLGTIVDLNKTEHIFCTPEPGNGFGNTLPPEAVKKARSTDVLLRFGFGFLKGDILDAPTHGTLSYHHGDFRKYRGRPPGFWEFLNGEKEAGITLQRLNETLDAGEVVVENRIQISDCDTWQEVKRRLFNESQPMLTEAIRRFSREDFTPEKVSDLGPVYTRPTTPDFVRYLWKNTTGRL